MGDGGHSKDTKGAPKHAKEKKPQGRLVGGGLLIPAIAKALFGDSKKKKKKKKEDSGD